MKIEFYLTRTDYFDYCKHAFFKTDLKSTVFTGIGTLAVVQAVTLLTRKNVPIGYWIISSAVFSLIYCLMIYRSLLKAKNMPLADGSILGKKIIEFTEEGIKGEDKDSVGLTKWNAIKNVEETNSAFYLNLDTNMAIMIPKRVFSDPSEMKAFLDFVQSKWRA